MATEEDTPPSGKEDEQTESATWSPLASRSPGENRPLVVGIDLGTSRTAIMTSRGGKKLIRSVVGYPRDLIGLKLLETPYVVGQAALDNRSYLDLRYPLEDGVLRDYGQRDIEVARHLLHHVIRETEPRAEESICAVIGVPARASAVNKAALLRMAHEVVSTALVVSEPFMVAFALGKLVNSVVIDIGAGTVDLCALKGILPLPEDQVTLTKAGNFIDQKLLATILENHADLQITLGLACAIKEQHAFVGQPSAPVRVGLRAAGKPVTRDLTAEVRRACEAILPEIVENVKLLIERFQPEDQPVALRNIIIAGGGSQIRGIADYIAGQMQDYGEVAVTCVEDPVFCGCAGALNLAQELPPKYWPQLGDTIT